MTKLLLIAFILLSSTTQAQDMPWATKFSAVTTLANNGFPNGITSSTGTFIANVNLDSDDKQAALYVDNGLASPSCPGINREIFASVNRNGINLLVRGSLTVGCGGQKTTQLTSVISPPLESGYYNIIFSWDISTSLAKCAINGVIYTLDGINYNGVPEAINYHNKPIYIGLAGDATDIGLFAGGSFIEPSSVVDSFFDIETRYVRRNASNGSFLIQDRQPIVWLSGPPPDKILLNTAPGTYSWPVTYNDTDPTGNFYLYSGTMLLPADSDPFEPGSGE